MKVLFVGFKYDYGIPSRGESLEIKSFYPAIEKNCNECHGSKIFFCNVIWIKYI